MANNFTPEQIEQFLQEFFTVVGRRQYIGMRYVPIFGRKGESSIEWDNSAPYEPLTIVLHQGDSYTSRQYVPTGIDILNENYWALTGNYNAQIEAYVEDVSRFDGRITANEDAISNINDSLPSTDFDEENTVKAAIDSVSTDLSNYKTAARSMHGPQDYIVDLERFTMIKDLAESYHEYIYSGMTYHDGYIYALRYANTSSNSHLIKISLSSLTIVDDVDLGAYYHGNCVFMYNGNIYITGNSNYVVVSTAMSVVKIVTISAHISTFIPNEDTGYALGIGAGSNISGIYRKSNGLFSKIGVQDTTDFGLSGLQDGCIAFGLFCTLQGHVMNNTNDFMRSVIGMRTYNGKSVFNIILPDIEDEPEGIFFNDNSFYILSVWGKIYRLDMPTEFATYNPVIDFYNTPDNGLQAFTFTPNVYERSSECISDNGWVDVPYSDSTYKIHRFIYVPKAFDTESCPYMNNFVMEIGGMRSKINQYQSIEGGEKQYIDLRTVYYGTSMAHIVYWWVAYRPQTNGENGLFLAAISARDIIGGTNYRQDFLETDTDAQFIAKAQSMLAWATNSGSGYNMTNAVLRICGNRTSLPQYVKL